MILTSVLSQAYRTCFLPRSGACPVAACAGTGTAAGRTGR